MKRIRVICIVMVLCFWGVGADASIKLCDDPLVQTLRSWLNPFFHASKPYDPGTVDERIVQLARFYDQLDYNPAWVNCDGLSPQGISVMEILREAADEEFWELKEELNYFKRFLTESILLKDFGFSFYPEDLVRLEISLTHIIMRYATGLLKKNLVMETGTVLKRESIWAALPKALDKDCFKSLQAAIQPQHPQYNALFESLSRYETIRRLGGWPSIDTGPALRVGRRDSRVPTLRWRLIITGDMPLDLHGMDEIYDAGLADGIRNFQQRHGLEADGVMGKRTLRALNIPVEDRISQIKVNIERWHRLPVDMGSRYLLVNIPNYQLDIVEGHRIVESMRAIVGKKDRETPVLSSMMTYIILNPYWNVPQKIARIDLLPKIQDNPEFLTTRKIQVFDSWQDNAQELDPLTIDWQQFSNDYFPLRLRQEPDPSNALGQVKFMFPNPFSVYIHDTPGKILFKKKRRNYSSGCIRIEKPMRLAEYLLKDQHWDREKIKSKVDAKKRKVIVLEQPLPVHLVYLTSWRNDLGQAHFREDIYDLDRDLIGKPTKSDSAANMTHYTLFDLLDHLQKDGMKSQTIIAAY